MASARIDRLCQKHSPGFISSLTRSCFLSPSIMEVVKKKIAVGVCSLIRGSILASRAFGSMIPQSASTGIKYPSEGASGVKAQLI